MPAINEETGITNLGVVPTGMTFSAAVAKMRPLRKYTIRPEEFRNRMTLCDTLRMLWRETEKLPPGPDRDQMQDYIAASYDYAKRMDARMKELKNLLGGRR